MSERMLYVPGTGWTKQKGDKFVPPSQSTTVTPWKGNGTASTNGYLWGNTGFGGTPCNHEKKKWKPAWESDGLRFFGTGKTDIPDLEENDPKQLVLNCSGWGSSSATTEFVKEAPSCLKNLQAHKFMLVPKAKIKADEMVLDWSDGSAPRLQPIFWPAFVSEVKANGYQDIVVCCFAGHGRTGTALACLALAMNLATDPDSAVDFVRKHHCNRAIETFSQIDYIEIVAMVLHKWQSTEKDGHCLSKPSK